jgi:hypothetical protein
MTHTELVTRAARWLRDNPGLSVVSAADTPSVPPGGFVGAWKFQICPESGDVLGRNDMTLLPSGFFAPGETLVVRAGRGRFGEPVIAVYSALSGPHAHDAALGLVGAGIVGPVRAEAKVP